MTHEKSMIQIKKLYEKKDRMHNWNHILRIKKKANLIKKNYKKVDEKLLSFIINFHGLKNYVNKNKKKFNGDFVKSLIRSHRKPIKVEEKIVFDANMLDNVGEQGIRKALYVGKLKGRNKVKTYEYLKKNSSKIKFYTKKGKEIGKKDIEIMMEKIK